MPPTVTLHTDDGDVAYENGSETLWSMFTALGILDADELEDQGFPVERID